MNTWANTLQTAPGNYGFNKSTLSRKRNIKIQFDLFAPLFQSLPIRTHFYVFRASPSSTKLTQFRRDFEAISTSHASLLISEQHCARPETMKAICSLPQHSSSYKLQMCSPRQIIYKKRRKSEYLLGFRLKWKRMGDFIFHNSTRRKLRSLTASDGNCAAHQKFKTAIYLNDVYILISFCRSALWHSLRKRTKRKTRYGIQIELSRERSECLAAAIRVASWNVIYTFLKGLRENKRQLQIYWERLDW